MKIIHVITGLNVGGAEMMLYKILQHSSGKEFLHEVISLTDVGLVGEKIQKLGVPVRALNMKEIDLPITVIRLALWLRKSNPDVVQTWMYHANLVGGLAATLCFKKIPVVWGIRQSDLNPKLNKRRTILVAQVGAFLSRFIPGNIIINSIRGKKNHEALGYEASKMVVIPNGFDLKVFRPDTEARILFRQKIGISPTSFIIGSVARFDPSKDQKTLIQSAKILLNGYKDLHFVLCGRGMTDKNKLLTEWINEIDIAPRLHLLGECEGIENITAAFDVAVLSSVSEGFPNVIGEAMACGVPCVVTDAGDSAYIVGDTGLMVPPSDQVALANAFRQMIEMKDIERKALGERARKRIEENFSIDLVVKKYIELYTSLA
ncbi:hypothetical protein A2738_03905 [Candidatus Nomurabacteria bacterium RIFCSPHIGHO2_01_FULL_42_15]|uniref:Glycosyltransferase subfamily 4-like N-terminal domain-containing protein n=1 Tax=Candidatus Nomurabacteria bacterium RIFCSPHIGHO2_01_FULL_42_15 TaxID=1801742 RepID=A0A1F6VE64_9BACT|nr:MAG: hypothetical protein A2738_03905 [Candidatus Nomurabacteria bacterium RIFCSPHIGHO2_01_FULL_42_15]OGI93347.1 MAG: hypothetical protein A3A99_03760 [Candidatus Nomurabacteria bacterium RIFCSPLOWO2_01_FULL_41_18]